jgi:hypothetical protein
MVRTSREGRFSLIRGSASAADRLPVHAMYTAWVQDLARHSSRRPSTEEATDSSDVLLPVSHSPSLWDVIGDWPRVDGVRFRAN